MYGLLTVDGTLGRRASWSSRCAVHQALLTIERSLISRTGARRSRERCSSFEIDGPRDELKRIAYFDLLESFASPRRLHASVPEEDRNRNCTEVDLPTSIRGRSPPFLFVADPHGSAARSIAMPGRDRPPMTQDDPGCRAPTFPPAKMATCGGGGSWAVRPHT